MRGTELQGILQDMYDRNHELTPELVVSEAKDPKHPLHHRFEWDDAEAAKRHRVQQAREIIRSVRIEYAERPDGTPKTVRAFVSRQQSRIGTGYAPIAEVMADPVQAQIMLNQARRELKQFKARYGHLAEYASLIAEMNAEEAS